ncbi:MAG: antiporter, family [Candidatus Dependentiae bacterium]|nr:antiporter, family [Candidatus Dependentiae bacterium]
MLSRIITSLWGELSREEMKKFGLLSSIFFLLIGSYWLLRTQKNAVFDALVGYQYQPRAKIINLFASVVLVLIYSKLIDILGKKNLLLTLAMFFSGGFMLFAYLLQFSSIGFADPVASPYRLLGWFIYLMTEWIGSLMVGLFWAFVTSTTKAESAKKGYPLILAGAQIGAVIGSYLSFKTEYFGITPLFTVGSISLGLIIPMVFLYLKLVPVEPGMEPKAVDGKKPKTGMLEGLKILATRPYIMGIFAVSTIYEVINTILEFEMNMIAKQTYITKEAFASFNGTYGILVNTLAFLFALLGTSLLIRRFGLRFCLLMFPIMTAGLVVGVYFSPVLGMLLGACMAIKGLSYALNNPTKEMMYIPTSQDVRFKAKGWVDQFGSRSSKGAGSIVSDLFKSSISDLLLYSTVISLGLIGVWVVAAAYVGSRFKVLTDTNQVVE